MSPNTMCVSVLQQISDNRGRKLRTDGSKSNNLSFNESDHTMSISPSKSDFK